MKKFHSLVLILLTLLCSVVLSACGDKFKDLKMSFYSVDGEVVEEVNLIIDETNEKSWQRISVKFEGINENDIGQVAIVSSPVELLNITNKVYDGQFVYADISANCSGIGKLEAIHLTTGRKASIDLVIDQKSIGAELKKSNYVIEIPNQGSNEHLIKTNDLIKLLNPGSTDEIYFKAVTQKAVEGIEPIEVEFDGQKYISGFKVYDIDNLKIADSIVLSPVTVMQGYEATLYDSLHIKIHFVKPFDEDTLVLTYGEDKNEAKNFELLANAKDSGYNLQKFDISMKIIDTFAEDANVVSVLEYYDVVPTISDKNVIVDNVNDNHYIVRADAGDVNAKVTMQLVPKSDYVGELKTVEKSFNVTSKLIADKIDVSKDGNVINNPEDLINFVDLSNIELYNYYSSGFGALFNFKPVAKSLNGDDGLHEKFKKVQIKVKTTMLSAEHVAEEKLPAGAKRNGYVFEIYKGTQRLNFTLGVGTDNIYAYSEEFSGFNDIFIRYSIVDENVSSNKEDLALEVMSVAPQVGYEGIKLPSVELGFNKKYGVQQTDVNVGFSQGGQADYYTNVDKSVVTLEENATLYLDINEGIDNTKIPFNIFAITAITANDQILYDVELEFVVESKHADNGLKLYPSPSTRFDKGNIDNSNVKSNFTYKISETANTVGFVYDKNTELGEYVVKIQQKATEFEFVFKCIVYDGNAQEQLSGQFALDDKVFKNKAEWGYNCDYIVEKGQSVKISIDLPQHLIDYGFVSDYNFTTSSDIVLGEGEKLADYVSQSAIDGNKATFTFNKGTFVDGKKYIAITLSAKIKQFKSVTINNELTFKNILQQEGSADITKDIKFFVYEPISYNNINLNEIVGPKYVYGDGLLPESYKEYSTVNLKIEGQDDLWNYITANTKCNIVTTDNSASLNTNLTQQSELVDNRTCKIVCSYDGIDYSAYQIEITVIVYQFNNTVELHKKIDVRVPILTEQIVVNNQNVYTTENDPTTLRLGLKQGESFTLDAEQISSLGEVTFKGLNVSVVDEIGNASKAVKFDAEQKTFTVLSVDSDLKLVVTAKDKPDVKVEILLDLQDGKTMETAYIIYNADDFWKINDNKEAKTDNTVYYKLIDNINMSFTSIPQSKRLIEDFTGVIFSENNGHFRIYNLELNNVNRNVFKNFQGEMTDIQFVVNFDYNNLTNDNEYTPINLGVIDVVASDSALKGVSVEVGGQATLKYVSDKDDDQATLNGNINFGALVGENNGQILYTDVNYNKVAVSGDIELSGSGFHFGGLVGVNKGTIDGGLSFATTINSDTTANIVVSINKTDTTTLLNITSSATGAYIGGLVGLNNAKIQNVSANGTIEGKDNIGGLIGHNVTQIATWRRIDGNDNELETSNCFVANAKVSSTIKGTENVGGVVGVDESGTYTNCMFQVLADSNGKAIIGTNNVGGIAGCSTYGKFQYCSVMSYRWDYSKLIDDGTSLSTFKASENTYHVADIVGDSYVAGIVGCAVSDNVSEMSTNQVVVYNSSVNGYLALNTISETLSENIIAGLMCTKCTTSTTSTTSEKSYAFNAYFMGKLSSYNNDLYIDYQSSVLNANCYVVAESESSLKIARSTDFKLNLNDTESSLPKHWFCNAVLNGKYIVIVDDNTKTSPNYIFEIAPESVEVKVKENNKHYADANTLWLEYYNFIGDNLSEELLNELNSKTNVFVKDDWLAWLEFKVTPNVNPTFRVESSKESVLKINADGSLRITGIGECTLTFTSVLNSKATATINVNVTYPLASEYSVVYNEKVIAGKNELGSPVSAIVPVAKGKTIRTTIAYVGLYEYASLYYNYIVNHEMSYDVELAVPFQALYTDEYTEYIYDEATWNNDIKKGLIYTFDGTNYTQATGNYASGTTYYKRGYKNFEDVINVSGLPAEVSNDGVNEILTFKLNPTAPMSFSVNDLISEDINVLIKAYFAVENSKKELGEKTFIISTKQGASEIALNYNSAILYPNYTTMLTANIKTDIKLTQNDFEFDIYLSVNGAEFANNDYFKIEVIEIGAWIDGQQQVTFKITIDETKVPEKDVKRLAYVTIYPNKNETTVYATVKYTILPQEINSIEVENYVYTIDEGTTTKLTNVVEPSKDNRIHISMAPINGYFDYLEIIDTTGNEEIEFLQHDENGNLLEDMTQSADSGKGIKLFKVAGEETIYVKLFVDPMYSSKLHTLKVLAFVNESSIPIKTQELELYVAISPQITATYKLPNGSDGQVASTENNQVNQSVYMANQTQLNFYVTTRESDGVVNITGLENSEGFKLVVKPDIAGNNGDGLYIITLPEVLLDGKTINDYLGQSFDIVFETTGTMINGETKTSKVTFTITIVEYVIHSVSLTEANSFGRIQGRIGQEIPMEIYFDSTDISVYDSVNETYWNKGYKLDSSIINNEIDSIDPVDVKIKKMLNKLNTWSNGINEYLVLNNGDMDSVASKNIELEDKILKVTNEEYSPKYLGVSFKLNKKNNYFELSDTGSVSISKNHELLFAKVLAEEEYDLVTNQEEFEAMIKGGRYILGDDIVLTNYKPVDVDLLEFDGNGRTITIASFAEFETVDIKAGLFAKIYDNMVVKNVNVQYYSYDVTGAQNNYSFGDVVNDNGKYKVTHYYDFCSREDIAYTSVVFGGLTPENYGVVTNCNVFGEIAVKASSIESKPEIENSRPRIKFSLGGFVNINGETGYITHSTSALNIFAMAEIGGFVYDNQGVIASSAVDTLQNVVAVKDVSVNNGNNVFIDEKNQTFTPVFYNYNNKKVDEEEFTIYAEMGLFAFTNSKKITMSYVNVVGTNVYVKDEASGFVFNNKASGSIENCYTHMLGQPYNNNEFTGFVYVNDGLVSKSYTNISNGYKNDANLYMFAKDTTNLVDCIEFVNFESMPSYKKNNKGLFSESIFDLNNADCYIKHNFVVGDNVNGVWQVQIKDGAKLVSTLNKVVYTDNQNGVAEKAYYGLRNISFVDGDNGEKSVEVDNSTYGTKQNPYLIATLSDWDNHFEPNSRWYYRIVKDIDFGLIGKGPSTSSYTFSGNIQGNNMVLSNILLYSEESLSAMGLFKEIVATGIASVDYAVSNLNLTVESVYATKTKAVGVLAGIIENYNLYNIHIDSPDVIVVGGNAVGGIAGIVRGDFDIQDLSSNVGVNSTRATNTNIHSIYMSKNNSKDVSANLNKVYYAGSVIGILDGYNEQRSYSDSRDISSYFNVRNIKVSNALTLVGNYVGGAFGFVGEKVKVDNVEVNIINSNFKGSQHSAGVIGENRGVLINANVILSADVKEGEIEHDAFASSRYASAGAVGLNNGGLIKNVNVRADIVKKLTGTTVGGIVGVNINGSIVDCAFDGKIQGYFAGGIIGENYTDDDLYNYGSGAGALDVDCRANANLLPKEVVKYTEGKNIIPTFRNVRISEKTFRYMVETAEWYFSTEHYKPTGDDPAKNVEFKNMSRVLGMCVGVQSENVGSEFNVTILNNPIETVNEQKWFVFINIPAEKDKDGNIINGVMGTQNYYITLPSVEGENMSIKYFEEGVKIPDGIEKLNAKLFNPNEIKNLLEDGEICYIFIVGAEVTAYGVWNMQQYSDELLILTTITPVEYTVTTT